MPAAPLLIGAISPYLYFPAHRAAIIMLAFQRRLRADAFFATGTKFARSAQLSRAGRLRLFTAVIISRFATPPAVVHAGATLSQAFFFFAAICPLPHAARPPPRAAPAKLHFAAFFPLATIAGIRGHPCIFCIAYYFCIRMRIARKIERVTDQHKPTRFTSSSRNAQFIYFDLRAALAAIRLRRRHASMPKLAITYW